MMEKCDIAQKMGMTDKEIYIEIWNRSNQCSGSDYKVLIATKDYQTIKDEVMKKLRKKAMNYK